MEDSNELSKPWHLKHFNDGAEIHFINEDGFSEPISLSFGDDGHSMDIELLQHLVRLHNAQFAELDNKSFCELRLTRGEWEMVLKAIKAFGLTSPLQETCHSIESKIRAAAPWERR